MLEPTDRIILKKEDLLELITVLTGSNNVEIHTEPIINKGCCITLSKEGVCPVRVTKILVNGTGFFIHYNELFNIFAQYNVYTDICFIEA